MRNVRPGEEMMEHPHPALEHRQHLQNTLHKTSVPRGTLPFLLRRDHAQHPQVQVALLRSVLPPSLLREQVVIQHHQHPVRDVRFRHQHRGAVRFQFALLQMPHLDSLPRQRLEGDIASNVGEIDL